MPKKREIKKRQRDQVLMVKVSTSEKQALAQAAVDQDLTASQLVRQAIKHAIRGEEELRHATKSA